MTKKSRQKLRYLEKEKSFEDEINKKKNFLDEANKKTFWKIESTTLIVSW